MSGEASSFEIRRPVQTGHTKRTHSQMEAGHRLSPSPLFVRQDSLSSEAASPPRSRSHSNTDRQGFLALPPLRARYPGDGLDFRRPASMTSTAGVIDLTDDDGSSMTSTRATPHPEPATAAPVRSQRLPRYDREIIDLSVDTSPPVPRHSVLPRPQAPYARQPPSAQAQAQAQAQQEPRQNIAAVRSSPDVEFVSARPLLPFPRLQSRQPTPFAQRHEPHRPFVDLAVDLDDDVVHVRTTDRTGVNLQPPQGRVDEVPPNDLGMGRLFHFMRRNAPMMGARHWSDFRQMFVGRHPWEPDDEDDDLVVGHTAQRYGGTRPPPVMDYTTIGFGIAFEEETPPRPPTPKYTPPPDPGSAFTRCPQEDDELVCPNCLSVLGMGDTDEKKQVWIVKACGHVYCGECMLNRKKKPSKGKAKITEPVESRPFSSCQAPNCTKKTSHKTHVMQIFL